MSVYQHNWRRFLGMLVFLLSACTMGGEQNASPGVLELSLPAGDVLLDPQRVGEGAAATLTANLFAGLMMVDPQTGEAIPDLAVGPPEVSTNGLTYTFTLRQNLVWMGPNKEAVAPLTTHDVVFTIRRLCDNSTPPHIARPFYIIKKCAEANQAVGTADLEAVAVRAIDAQIVEFTLTGPAAYFPLLLSHHVARPLPEQWVIQGDAWSRPDRIVTSGPFLLDLFDPTRGVRLLRNPHFYAADQIQLTEINFAFAADPTAPLAAYVRDLLDSAPVPPGLVAQVTADKALQGQVQQIAGTCSHYVGFTTVKAPLDRREVRLALSQAIDRQGLVSALLPGAAAPAHFLTPPGILGSPAGEGVGLQSNRVMAQDTLARAGYADGVGVPSVQLAYSQEGINDQIAAAIQDMWQTTLRISVTVQAIPPALFNDVLRSTTPLPQMPHAWLMRHCGSFPDAYAWLAPTFDVAASPNVARRVPTLFESLLAQAISAKTTEKRRDLYVQAERVLVLDETVYAPLFHQNQVQVAKPWLTPALFPFGGPEFRHWRLDMVEKLAARTAAQAP